MTTWSVDRRTSLAGVALLLCAGALSGLCCSAHGGVAVRPVPVDRAVACELGASVARITVADARPDELQEVYQLDDNPRLWEPAPADAQRSRYAAAVTQRLGGSTDQRELLRRQHDLYAAAPQGAKDAANSAAVLKGEGTIAPISCAEAAIWKVQDARFPMLTHPTEFGAFILRRAARVRVYLSSLDRLGQKVRSEVTERVKADVADGWTLTAHLHVHPFLFDRVVGDRMWTQAFNTGDVGGAVAPSSNDVHFYRSVRAESGLEAAWVTNGLDTGHYPAAAFEAFQSAAREQPAPDARLASGTVRTSAPPR